MDKFEETLKKAKVVPDSSTAEVVPELVETQPINTEAENVEPSIAIDVLAATVVTCLEPAPTSP